ncbi:MAG: hypothetical protein ACM3RX_03220 [Methanococcaceae archaeon]
MKKMSKIASLSILLACIIINSSDVSAQNAVCVYCGIPLSAATRGSDHKPSCQYYTPPRSTTTKPATTSSPSSSGSTAEPTPIGPTNVSGTIIQTLVPFLLSSPDPEQTEAEEKAKALEKERVAAENAEKKRIQDEIDQAKHDKLMESYKTLPGSTSIGFKSLPLSTGNAAKTTDSEPLDTNTVALQEQKNFEKDTATWIGLQKKLFNERLENSNKWASNLSASLTSKVPPLPYKKFDELQPGDVLLIAPGKGDLSIGIVWADQLASGSTESSASHTVTFLKEVNGQKLFMDNQPRHGPTIISENQFYERYGSRSMDVARLASCGIAQPLNEAEAEKLFKAAVKMQSDNLKSGGTNYGVRGDNDVVCSEASWALIKASGRKISGTDFGIKSGIGVDFSPADFYAQKQYFLVTPLNVSK